MPPKEGDKQKQASPDETKKKKPQKTRLALVEEEQRLPPLPDVLPRELAWRLFSVERVLAVFVTPPPLTDNEQKFIAANPGRVGVLIHSGQVHVYNHVLVLAWMHQNPSAFQSDATVETAATGTGLQWRGDVKQQRASSVIYRLMRLERYVYPDIIKTARSKRAMSVRTPLRVRDFAEQFEQKEPGEIIGSSDDESMKLTRPAKEEPLRNLGGRPDKFGWVIRVSVNSAFEAKGGYRALEMVKNYVKEEDRGRGLFRVKAKLFDEQRPWLTKYGRQFTIEVSDRLIPTLEGQRSRQIQMYGFLARLHYALEAFGIEPDTRLSAKPSQDWFPYHVSRYLQITNRFYWRYSEAEARILSSTPEAGPTSTGVHFTTAKVWTKSTEPVLGDEFYVAPADVAVIGKLKDELKLDPVFRLSPFPAWPVEEKKKTGDEKQVKSASTATAAATGPKHEKAGDSKGEPLQAYLERMIDSDAFVLSAELSDVVSKADLPSLATKKEESEKAMQASMPLVKDVAGLVGTFTKPSLVRSETEQSVVAATVSTKHAVEQNDEWNYDGEVILRYALDEKQNVFVVQGTAQGVFFMPTEVRLLARRGKMLFVEKDKALYQLPLAGLKGKTAADVVAMLTAPLVPRIEFNLQFSPSGHCIGAADLKTGSSFHVTNLHSPAKSHVVEVKEPLHDVMLEFRFSVNDDVIAIAHRASSTLFSGKVAATATAYRYRGGHKLSSFQIPRWFDLKRGVFDETEMVVAVYDAKSETISDVGVIYSEVLKPVPPAPVGEQLRADSSFRYVYRSVTGGIQIYERGDVYASTGGKNKAQKEIDANLSTPSVSKKAKPDPDSKAHSSSDDDDDDEGDRKKPQYGSGGAPAIDASAKEKNQKQYPNTRTDYTLSLKRFEGKTGWFDLPERVRVVAKWFCSDSGPTLVYENTNEDSNVYTEQLVAFYPNDVTLEPRVFSVSTYPKINYRRRDMPLLYQLGGVLFVVNLRQLSIAAYSMDALEDKCAGRILHGEDLSGVCLLKTIKFTPSEKLKEDVAQPRWYEMSRSGVFMFQFLLSLEVCLLAIVDLNAAEPSFVEVKLPRSKMSAFHFGISDTCDVWTAQGDGILYVSDVLDEKKKKVATLDRPFDIHMYGDVAVFVSKTHVLWLVRPSSNPSTIDGPIVGCLFGTDKSKWRKDVQSAKRPFEYLHGLHSADPITMYDISISNGMVYDSLPHDDDAGRFRFYPLNTVPIVTADVHEFKNSNGKDAHSLEPKAHLTGTPLEALQLPSPPFAPSWARKFTRDGFPSLKTALDEKIPPPELGALVNSYTTPEVVHDASTRVVLLATVHAPHGAETVVPDNVCLCDDTFVISWPVPNSNTRIFEMYSFTDENRKRWSEDDKKRFESSELGKSVTRGAGPNELKFTQRQQDGSLILYARFRLPDDHSIAGLDMPWLLWVRGRQAVYHVSVFDAVLCARLNDGKAPDSNGVVRVDSISHRRCVGTKTYNAITRRGTVWLGETGAGMAYVSVNGLQAAGPGHYICHEDITARRFDMNRFTAVQGLIDKPGSSGPPVLFALDDAAEVYIETDAVGEAERNAEPAIKTFPGGATLMILPEIEGSPLDGHWYSMRFSPTSWWLPVYRGTQVENKRGIDFHVLSAPMLPSTAAAQADKKKHLAPGRQALSAKMMFRVALEEPLSNFYGEVFAYDSNTSSRCVIMSPHPSADRRIVTVYQIELGPLLTMARHRH